MKPAMKKAVGRAVRVSAFALAYVVNPAYLTACGDASEEEQAREAREARIEAELLAELDAFKEIETWTFVSEQGDSYELELELVQRQGEDMGEITRAPGLMNRAFACGTRTFFQSASACATFYELAVEGTLTLRKVGEMEIVAEGIPVEGSLAYDDLTLQIDGSSSDVVRFSKRAEEFVLVEVLAGEIGVRTVRR